jgi:biotin synthase
MVSKIRELDMEVCTTLGMLTPDESAELHTVALTAYNHDPC